MTAPEYRLTVEDAPAEPDIEVLPHALEAYNERQWPQHPPWRPLAVFARSEGQIVAGLAGDCSSNIFGSRKTSAAEASDGN